MAAVALCEAAAGADLELIPWEPPPGPDPLLEVLACSPGAWDLQPPTSWPRIGGGVLAGRDPEGALWLCGGYLPCGRCTRCGAGLLLACEQPIRPGWNAPGGLASRVRLPANGRAPAELAASHLPEVVALLAAAGLVYQAQALAGMVPGDTVVVVGEPGPAALPLRLLVAGGLRPLWLDGRQPLPEGVTGCDEPPAFSELPSPRCHLLDLQPSAASVARWLPLAAGCLSISLLGPPAPSLWFEPAAVLGGQATLRCVRDLHPHLILDVAALVTSDRVSLDGALDVLPRSEAAPVLRQHRAGRAQRWPVVI